MTALQISVQEVCILRSIKMFRVLERLVAWENLGTHTSGCSCFFKALLGMPEYIRTVRGTVTIVTPGGILVILLTTHLCLFSTPPPIIAPLSTEGC